MINQKYIAAVSGILFISSALTSPLSPAGRGTVRQRQEQLLQQNQQQREALCRIGISAGASRTCTAKAADGQRQRIYLEVDGQMGI